MTRATETTDVRAVGGCQNFIEYLGRSCRRHATIEFHERDTKTKVVTAIPVCLQHARKLLAEATTTRHRKAWLSPIGAA